MESIDLEKIYDPRTRQYMSEILKCYEAESFRSAIVLLNSVCSSDLFYKLQELKELYSDTVASQIIQEIDTQIAKDKYSPIWEKTLVDSIFSKTKLLDASGYTLLLHLRDYRNLTAHPVLDNSSSLYQPSRELVESCIVEAYNSILVKPSVFVKDIVSFMSQDLDSKRKYILQDKEGFKTYIEQKYLIHMSEPMLIKVFRTFWKFTFVISNQECDNNRSVNYALINYLLHKYKAPLEAEICANTKYYSLEDINNTTGFMIFLLSQNAWLFSYLSVEIKSLIQIKCADNPVYMLVSWFGSPSKTEYIETLIESGYSCLPEKGEQQLACENLYGESGEKDALLKYYIFALRQTAHFTDANTIMDYYIIPNIQAMNKVRLEDLIDCFNTNNQLYWNYYFSGYCGRVWKYAQKHFDKAYITATYPKFKIPEQIIPVEE